MSMTPDPTPDRNDTPSVRTGVYRATYADGAVKVVAMVRCQSGRLAAIPVSDVLVEPDTNWESTIFQLEPLARQGGLSGAMYWDDPIDVAGPTIRPQPGSTSQPQPSTSSDA